MIDMAVDGWRAWRDLIPWLVGTATLPAATLFVLVLWLSQRFIRDGFDDVRQHLFAAVGGSGTLASAQRNWWSCTCASMAACGCLSAVARSVRRCCIKMLALNNKDQRRSV